MKSNLGKKTKHCPDPTGRGANDTNHANADINISYFMGLNHLRSLICTYSADDLRSSWKRSRNLSSSTASAMKPTVCGSAITFLFNCAFSSCDQNRFAIDKAGQLVLMNLQSVARILSGVQCP